MAARAGDARPSKLKLELELELFKLELFKLESSSGGKHSSMNAVGAPRVRVALANASQFVGGKHAIVGLESPSAEITRRANSKAARGERNPIPTLRQYERNASPARAAMPSSSHVPHCTATTRLGPELVDRSHTAHRAS